MYLVEFSKYCCITCSKIHVVILLSNWCSQLKEAYEVTPLKALDITKCDVKNIVAKFAIRDVVSIAYNFHQLM